jgi:hypothetical protein
MKTPISVTTFIARSMLIACVPLLAACANTSSPSGPNPSLGMLPSDIPALLSQAQKQPYAVATDQSCAGLAGEVSALTALLGPDLDAPVSEGNPGLLERGAGEGSNLVKDALRSSAENLIPYRGWLRKLTGAEQNAKQASAAVTAGAIRRGFLKGQMLAKSCA